MYKQKKIHQPVIINLTTKDGIFYLDDPKKQKKIKKNPEIIEIKNENVKILPNKLNETIE